MLAQKLTQRLVAAGFAADDIAFTPMGETGYLTARYPGRDRAAKPIVVLAHMDVVEADPAGLGARSVHSRGGGRLRVRPRRDRQ